MTNSKTTKRALFSSVVALLLCFTMLLGTTFAWFTDSAVSGNNIIKTGNLDMKLSWRPYGADHTEEWAEVTESTVLFGKDALYEPGYTEAVWLKVENLGSLAFRYDLAINVASEKQGTNKAGEKFSLSDYLEVKYMTTTSTDMESDYYTTRESLDSFAFGSAINSGVASLSDDIAVIKNGVAFSASDATNGAYSSAYVLVVISMPTTVGNEANHNGTDIPQIDFSLTALATQLAYESDSFGSDYDKDATYDEPTTPTIPPVPADAVEVASLDALNDALANGGNILLTESIELGSTLTVNADTAIWAEDGAKLTRNTLKTNNDFAELPIKGNGKLVLNGVSFEVPGEVYAQDSVNIEINGGYYKFATIASEDNSTVTINSGTVEFIAPYRGATWTADIILVANGEFNINGGTIINDIKPEIFNDNKGGTFTNVDCLPVGGYCEDNNISFQYGTANATLNINGGTFIGFNTLTTVNGNNNSANTHVNISGGEFTGTANVISTANAGILNLTGGTFSKEGSDSSHYSQWVADGYKAVDNTDGSVSIVAE